MSNFLNYTNRLRQFVPSLSPEQAEDYVNDAWRDIRESNDEWTFLYDTEYWLAPGSILLQSLGLTQFSASVTLTHTNLTQLGGLSNPALTLRQIRFGQSGGPIYGIASSDVQQLSDGGINAATTTLTSTSGPFVAGDVGKKIVVNGAGVSGANLETTIATFISPTQVTLTLAASTTVGPTATFTYGSTLTLDRVFNEQSSSTGSGLVYRVYYEPLSQDFDRIDFLADPILGYEFAIDIRDRAELDMIDPRRGSVGQPYRLYFHHFNPTTGLPVYEMWPGPTAQRAYTVAFWHKGTSFSADTDALPPRVAEELLLMRARILAYEWAMTAEPDPRKAQVYMNALQYARSRYSTEGQPGRALGLLDQAIRRDRSIALTRFKRFPRRYGPGWPIGDSNFAMNHAIPGWAFSH
jgi:hypothetical protein